MNVLNTTDEQAFLKAKQKELLALGLDELRDFAKSSCRLKEALKALKTLGSEDTERRVDRFVRQLDTFEPSVTMIGQIKSGKTSLVNALIGAPDLLPADVNPWTSVVTSLHLFPESPDFKERASFRFFDADEWDRLISGGGRIGELASRAGADEELEKIKRQVSEMREKSRARLGRKFELMLGQQRDYGYFDKDLIERYVCLGEEPDNDSPKDEQGRFADITKSADLTTQRASLPMRLCIRDTPGVNDTFMMREQITIRSIRDSRICVVVLSAHQALSSTDMALIRLISHVKSRDVIIFVNRVDELSDPSDQIPEIKKSIADTLRKHKGPEDAQVIFGSALWANYALQMHLPNLPKGSIAALCDLARQKSPDRSSIASAADLTEEDAWRLSGLPDLQAAISERIVQGVGAALLQKIGASAHNLNGGLAAAGVLSDANAQQSGAATMSVDDARVAVRRIIQDNTTHLRDRFDALLASFGDRMERVQENFLERATASLIVHLENYGELTPWTYDPAGLRVLLSSSHKVLARNSQASFDESTKTAADAFSKIYAETFSLGPADIPIIRPRAPQIPAPVSLGRTIALDLQGSWWKRWWLQRRGYRAYAESFHDLIKSETSPVISELRDDLANGVKEEACATFEAFLNEQQSVFETLARMQQEGPGDMKDYVARSTPDNRRNLMQETLQTLNEYAAT